MAGDGGIVFEVVAAEPAGSPTARAEIVVQRGGRLQGRPGIHLPDGVGGIAGPTARDLDLARAAQAAGADAVAASFVQRAADVQRLIDALGPDRPQVVAKIETASAVEQADEILAVADAVMVARGDLGIRLPLEDVPHVQKRLVRAAIAAGRPVITATQMLESMVTAAYPTRAEVSDVANAVFDGTDAVMLSAETAVGADPAEAVAVMAAVVARAEREADYLQWGAKLGKLRRSRPLSTTARITEATSEAAWRAATNVGAAAIVCCTPSGDTARAVARFRPTVPVLAVTPRTSDRARAVADLGRVRRGRPGVDHHRRDGVVRHRRGGGRRRRQPGRRHRGHRRVSRRARPRGRRPPGGPPPLTRTVTATRNRGNGFRSVEVEQWVPHPELWPRARLVGPMTSPSSSPRRVGPPRRLASPPSRTENPRQWVPFRRGRGIGSVSGTHDLDLGQMEPIASPPPSSGGHGRTRRRGHSAAQRADLVSYTERGATTGFGRSTNPNTSANPAGA